ncbi:hypothetical protein MMC22_001447 [Lobaria immixta]|nr:hypothetical protein [Lobaria immixta]
MACFKRLGRNSSVGSETSMSPPDGNHDMSVYELDIGVPELSVHPDYDAHLCRRHPCCEQELPTGNDNRNATKDGEYDLNNTSPEGQIAELPFSMSELLSDDTAIAELSVHSAAFTKTPSSSATHSQACSDTFQQAHHQETVHTRISNVSGSLPKFSWTNRNSSGQTIPAATTTKDLAKVLREHVHVLNKKWMKELTSYLGQDVRFFLCTPFESGIQSLQGYYRGILPRTFKDAFALMHIVYACAEIYQKNVEPQFRRNLSLRVLQWIHAIATPEDEQLFAEVAFQLWFNPEYPEVESVKYATQYYDNLQWRFHSSLPDVLGETQVIGLCSRYLYDFYYAKICERIAVQASQSSWNSTPPSATIQFMQTRIVDRLLLWQQSKKFFEPVRRAQAILRRGLLCNPREVQVMLTVDGRSSNQPQSIYNEYQKIVCSLCTDALSSTIPSPPACCYATTLDEIPSIHDGFWKTQHLANTLVERDDHFGSELSLDERQYKLPISMKFGQNANSLDFPATTLTDATLIGSPDSSGNKSNTTLSPTEVSLNSPVEVSSPMSNTGLLCHKCGFVSNAKRDRDQRSNIERHMKTVHREPTADKLLCSEPGCGKTFSRSDNLLRHCREDHGDGVDLNYRTRSQRRKTADDSS